VNNLSDANLNQMKYLSPDDAQSDQVEIWPTYNSKNIALVMDSVISFPATRGTAACDLIPHTGLKPPQWDTPSRLEGTSTTTMHTPTVSSPLNQNNRDVA